MIKKTRRISFVLHGWGKISKRISVAVPSCLEELHDTCEPAYILKAVEEALFEAEVQTYKVRLGSSANLCGKAKPPKRGYSPAGHPALAGPASLDVVDNPHKALIAEGIIKPPK